MRQRRNTAGWLILALFALGLSLSRMALRTQAAPLTTGTVTEYSIPTFKSQPVDITNGPDGNLWFTEGYGNKIGKVTPGSVFTMPIVSQKALLVDRVMMGPWPSASGLPSIP